MRVAGEVDVLPERALAALHQRGLLHVVCEGGPRWLHDLVAAGVVDEADITVAPLFAGNATTPRTPALEAVTRMRLTQVLTGDGYLMNRYLG